MSIPSTPKTCEESIVGGVGVLIFVDDERTVLPAQFSEDGVPAVKVLLEFGPVVEHGQCARDVVVAPGLVPETVKGIDDIGWVAMTADVRAPCEQKICGKALHVVKIMHAVQRFAAGENLLTSTMHDHEVAEDLGLK